MTNTYSIHPCCFSLSAFCTFLLFVSSLTCWGQPTNISGVVNSYAYVQGVDTTTNSLILDNAASASSFSLNDLVLIYQTQGASINQSNSTAFGSITDIRGAGSFELARVCAVTGNEVVIQHKLTQTYYDSTAAKYSIQLVKVASYTDARINGTLTADPWNGKTGGIIVLSVDDTLYIDGTIDASGLGFRGGEQEVYSGPSCSAFTNSTGYVYASTTTQQSGAKKGEGIAVYLTNSEYGRGPQANGGGGGNEHNAGGGGGANSANGGLGGTRYAPGFFDCNGDWPGLGGNSLSTYGYSATNQRAFLGGGGGAGSDNNNQSGNGGNGGGLIILLANVITGTGSIEANGGSVTEIGSDGNGGGGAGGSILLNANAINGAGLNLSAVGGNGGSTKINCEGPGGGGGGGVIWSSTGIGGAATTVAGGAAGQAQACGNSTQGAQSGSAGATLTSGFVPPQGIDPFACILTNDILLEGAVVQRLPLLQWQSDAHDIASWQLETTVDETWTAVANVSAETRMYQVPTPLQGPARFRIRGMFLDGRIELSNIVELFAEHSTGYSVSVSYAQDQTPIITMAGLSPSTPIDLQLLDLTGRMITQERLSTDTGLLTYSPEEMALAPGWYAVRVHHLGSSQVVRFLVRD